MATFDHSDIRGLVTARPMVRRELLGLVSGIVDHLMVPQRGGVDSSNLMIVTHLDEKSDFSSKMCYIWTKMRGDWTKG